MIKVNFSDGTTLAFDLNKPDDLQQWTEWSVVEDFQEKITGVGILHNKKFITIPYPKNFKKVRFMADLVYAEKKGKPRKLMGERLQCHADNNLFSMLVYTYSDPPPPVFARIDIKRVGKQMFSGVNVKGLT